MNEVECLVLQQFTHYGTRAQPLDRLKFSPGIARQLAKAQLVEIMDGSEPAPIHPILPTGAKSSASPAGQASPQTIAILSAAGEALAKAPAKRKPGRPRKAAQS